MKLVYDKIFCDSSYSSENDNASLAGRMEAAVSGLSEYFTGDCPDVITPVKALKEQILLAHEYSYVESIEQNTALFSMASLACGGAIQAAENAFGGNSAFACIRPPGHHAGTSSSWGHCTFNNLAIALLVLRDQKRIQSAFIIDIDAHTGDGTRSILNQWKKADVFNPYAETADEYVSLIESRLSEIQQVDIIAVSAGFDAYIHDVGHKLRTSDFERIGTLIKATSDRLCKGRRFAVLEGGYYLKDLGSNIAAFCRGFA